MNERATFLAMKFLIEAAKDKSDMVRFHDALADEIIDASNNTVGTL